MSRTPAPSRRRMSRLGLVAAAPLMLVGLSACSGQFARFGLPEAASVEAPHVGNLWVGAWIASFVVGALVWGLIGWAVVRYRRKDGDAPAPRQTTYHLPLELLYTLVPFLIIGVLFFYTIKASDAMIEQTNEPDTTINVIGQKWSWTFNYMEQDNPAIGVNAHTVGTVEVLPDLYLPVNHTVRINVDSADVIHSFWVPSFYFKKDAIPGHSNSFDVTPNRIGVYDGKCAELCGEKHAMMLFKVHVVSEEEYAAKVKEIAANGGEGERKLEEMIQAVLPSAAPEEHK